MRRTLGVAVTKVQGPLVRTVGPCQPDPFPGTLQGVASRDGFHNERNRGNVVNERNQRPTGECVRHVVVNGRHVWVLEDRRGIVEMTESKETLEHDHPNLRLDTRSTDTNRMS